jgi:hypothetical protein
VALVGVLGAVGWLRAERASLGILPEPEALPGRMLKGPNKFVPHFMLTGMSVVERNTVFRAKMDAWAPKGGKVDASRCIVCDDRRQSFAPHMIAAARRLKRALPPLCQRCIASRFVPYTVESRPEDRAARRRWTEAEQATRDEELVQILLDG